MGEEVQQKEVQVEAKIYILSEFKWKGDSAEGVKPKVAKEKYYYCGS